VRKYKRQRTPQPESGSLKISSGDFARDFHLREGGYCILFSALYQSREPILFMDIGTNDEMALYLSGKIISTAEESWLARMSHEELKKLFDR
jgi:hypothetical protein